MSERLLSSPEAVKLLAQRLQESKKVQEMSKDSESPNQEAWTLAHALADLEESFSTFREKLLPRLMDKDLKVEELEEILLDIGDEFEHVLYHMKDPKFYAHLFSNEGQDR